MISIADIIILNDLIIISELGRIWKEAVVAVFFFIYLWGGTFDTAATTGLFTSSRWYVRVIGEKMVE
jgi:hypothetical protein